MIINRKLLIGIIVVCVIAAAIFGNPYAYVLAAWIPFWIPLAVWIYLVWIITKKKTSLFLDKLEPELAERRLKRLKKFMLVAGISFVVFIVGFIVHNAIYGLYEKEELVSFFIALVALWVFIIATIGGLVIFLKGRRKAA